MSQNKVNMPDQPAGKASVALKKPNQGATSPQAQAFNQAQNQTQDKAKTKVKASDKTGDKLKVSTDNQDSAQVQVKDQTYTQDKIQNQTQAKTKTKDKVEPQAKTSSCQITLTPNLTSAPTFPQAQPKTQVKTKATPQSQGLAQKQAHGQRQSKEPEPGLSLDLGLGLGMEQEQELKQESEHEHGKSQAQGQIQITAPAPRTTSQTSPQNIPQTVSLNEVEPVTYAQTITQQKLDALIPAKPVHLEYFSSGFKTNTYIHVDLQENQLTLNSNEQHIAAYELSNWVVNFAGAENNNHNSDAWATGQGTSLRARSNQQSVQQVPQIQPIHQTQCKKQGQSEQQLLAAGLESNAMTDSAIRLNAQRNSTPNAVCTIAVDAIDVADTADKADAIADDCNDDNADDDKEATIAQAAAVLGEGLAESEPQNPYTQEINRLALQNDLKSLPQDLKCNVIQEYFAVFIKALNTIMINCNEREIVESGLEMIINQAAPIFEIEYKTFFYMCIHGAPKALFWMLQYPFFAKFFLVKQRTLTLNLPRNLVITHKIIDEQIALEVSTTMENYAELKKRFALTSVPNISLQDNIMLSLYEEQIMQKNLIKPLPKMTQRERIRKLVKLGGAFPLDPAKVRLRQVNHQIFSLHNLRVTELRNMSVALEKLAHAPRRLSRIFRKDFKHYFMPMQLIMKKMDSWVELYPVDQQCLLVQMDSGFFIRSPKDRSLVYTQESFKDHPIIILDGLEVCYKTQEEPPEETEFIRTYGDDSEYNYKGIAAFKELAARMAEAKEHLSQRFDDQDLDNFNDLYQDDEDEPWVPSTTLRQGQSFQGQSLQRQSLRGQSFQSQAYQSQFQAYQNHQSFNANDENGNAYEDELYQRSMTKRHLQASDFEISSLDEFEDDEDEDIAELEDNETFDFADEDAVLGENNDQPAELFSTPRQQPGNGQSPGRGQSPWQKQAPKGVSKKSGKTGQNGKAGKTTTSKQTKQRGNPSYISGVYFGSQGAAHPSQLRLFNERNLLVDELKVGFMIVTL